MSLEENKVLVRRYFEEALHNVDIYDEILTDDFQVHAIHHATINTEENIRGPKAYKSAATWLHSVWSDSRITVDELISDGDRVMARWTFHGIQTGEVYGIPSTGRKVSYTGINIFRVVDGKLAESWDMFDRLWLWQQLGVLSDTAEFLAKAREAFPKQQKG